MNPTVYFADATSLCRTVLTELGVPVSHRIPPARPQRFVTVTRTGGPRMNLVADNAQVTVDSWAESDDIAHDLAQLARARLVAAAGTVVDGVTIVRVQEISGPGWLPDDLSGQPRYRQSFSVATRGGPSPLSA